MDKFFTTTSGEELVIMLKSARKGGCTACRMIKSGVKSRKELPHTCELGNGRKINKNIKR